MRPWRLRPVGLAVGLVRSQPALAVALAVAALVPAAANAVSSGVVSTYYGTLTDGARGDNAGLAYRLQGDPGAGAPALAAAGVSPLWADPGAQVRSGDRAAPVLAVTSPAASAMHRLVGGRRPSGDGDATISPALAERLRVGIGDMVTVEVAGARSRTRISGITVAVTRPDELAVLRTGTVPSTVPTAWLTSRDLRDTRLLEALDSRRLRLRGVEALASERRDSDENPVIRGLRLSPAFFYLLTVTVLLSLLVAARRRVASALASLRAAGLSPRHLATVVATSTAVVVTAGLVVGTAVGVGLVSLAARPLGGAFGQWWVTGQLPPGPPPVGYVLGVALSVTVVAAAVSSGTGRLLDRSVRAAGSPRRRRAAVGGAVVAVTAVLCYLIPRPAVGANLLGAFAAGAALTVLTPHLVAGAQGRRRASTAAPGHASARVAAASGRSFVLAASALGMLAYVASGYSAFLGNDVAYGERNYVAGQPVGSLVVRDAKTTDLATVAAVATAEGRPPEIFPDPDERTGHVRVATVPYAQCLQTLPTRTLAAGDGVCSSGVTSAAPINGLALIPPGQPVLGESLGPDELLVDPSLIVDGQVALLSFGAEPGQVTGVRLQRARALSGLGGILPGAALRADSPLAATLLLSPSAQGTLVIPHVADLDGAARARIDGVVAQVAAVGFVDRNDGYEDHGSAALSLFLGVGGAAVVGAVMATMLGAYTISQAGIRSLFTSFGVPAVELRRLAWRCFAVPVVTVVIASLLGLVTAADVGAPGLLHYGFSWPAPALVALAAAAVAAAHYARPALVAGP